MSPFNIQTSTSFVILAAGGSSRMGRPKQLLEYKDATLIHHAIEIALRAKKLSDSSPDIFIVLGSKSDDIRYEISSTFNRKERKESTILINPEWQEGIASSIRCGVTALLRQMEHGAKGDKDSRHAHETDAALFLLCDQPLVTSEHLAAILDFYVKTDALIVASEYSNIIGVPALFRKALFPELLKLTGDEGARSVIRAHQKEALGIPFPAAEFTIDQPADYEKLISMR